MKKNFLIRFFLFLFFKSVVLFSQSPKAGSILTNYFPITKSFKAIKKTNSDAIYYRGFDSLMIDIDADYQVDLMIKSEYILKQSTKTIITQGISLFAGKGIQVVLKSDKNKLVLDALPNDIPLNNELNWSKGNELDENGANYIINYSEEYVGNAKKSVTYGVNEGVAYIGYRKILEEDTIYGWINMYLVFPGEVLGYSYECVGKRVALEPTNIISPKNYVCSNSDLTLNFVPEDGVITGRGMKGRTFYPLISQNEYENIYYTAANAKGCPNTASLTIEVIPVPNVTIDIIKENKDTVIFSTKPHGGIFEGQGLNGNMFLYTKQNPTYDVRYTYTDSLGCQSSVRIANKFSASFDPDNKISSSKNAKVKTPFYMELLILFGAFLFGLMYLGFFYLTFLRQSTTGSEEEALMGTSIVVFILLICLLWAGISGKSKNSNAEKAAGVK